MRLTRVFGALLALGFAAVGSAAQEAAGGEPRGFMGIGFEWEADGSAEATVGQVVPGSGAERAGVRRGDVVLRIDGQPATSATVDRLRERLKVGETVRLRLRRDGRELDQAVVAGAAAERRVMVLERGGDDDVITLRVPSGEARARMDTVRVHLERLHSRMDSLRGRLDILHRSGDSLVFRLERDGHHVRILGDSMRARMHALHGDALRGHARVRILRGDSARGHFRILHGDSGRGHVRILQGDSARGHGRVRVLRRDGDSVRIEMDSVIILHADSLHALPGMRHLPGMRDLELIESFPTGDMDPRVPFFMEMGRRGVAGAELVEMNPGLGRYFRTDRGVLVLKVSEGTPMARAGIEAGDVIVRAGDAEVREVAELRRAFASAGGDGKLRVQLLRQGASRTVELQWEPARWRVERRETPERRREVARPRTRS